MTATSVVTANGIVKRYGAVEALRGVAFTIASGESVGFAGDNGAGKSTLMKIVAGAVTPTSGELKLGDEEVTQYTPRHARDRGVEMVYQDLALCDNLDVRENIALGREPRRRWPLGVTTLSHRAMTDKAEELLDRLGISIGSVHEPVAGLSGGQRQAVAICRALACDPSLIIMDEPTAALSVGAAEPLLAMIRKLPEQGVSIMLVSHRLSDLLNAADRIYILRRGEIVGELKSSDVDEETILRMMAGIGPATPSTR